MNEKATLVKFGHFDHLSELQENGTLYMNNLPFFWGIENDELRGDKNDSVNEILRGKKGTLTPKEKNINPIKIQNWFFRVLPPEPEKINIYCMCAVSESINNFLIDERNFRFGEHSLLLIKPQEFIDRIATHMKQLKVRSNANLVEYINNDYRGMVGPFRKLRNFSYQSEWRIVCYNGPENVRQFQIGSIKAISIIVRSSELNQVLSSI